MSKFAVFCFCLALAVVSVQARPQRTEQTQGAAVCTICNFLVNYVEKFLQQNETQQQIIQKLEGVCHLFGSFQAQCQAFVESEAPALIQLLLEKEPPAKVCQQLHACQNSSVVVKQMKQVVSTNSMKQVKVPQDTACGLCELVSSVEQWLASNNTEQQIQTKLEAVCNALPGGVSGLCDQFVEQYLPLAIQWILNNEPPAAFCTQLGLCSSGKMALRRPVAVVKMPQLPKDGSLCGICELAIASVEQWLQQNSTVQEVEQYLDNVCSLFPASVSQLCDQFVAAYYPQAVQWILNNEQPQVFCTQIGVCTSVKAAPLRRVRGSRH